MSYDTADVKGAICDTVRIKCTMGSTADYLEELLGGLSSVISAVLKVLHALGMMFGAVVVSYGTAVVEGGTCDTTEI